MARKSLDYAAGGETMRSIVKVIPGCGRCLTLVALAALAACGGENTRVEEAQPVPPTASTEAVPESIPMGGSKSVTRFFVTSVGLGDGGNLGGLAGADAHCQALADDAGAGDRTWRAYLSTQGPGAVNARDRIGSGPWANAKGIVMATDVENLHYDNSNINFEHALDENGDQFDSRIDDDYDSTEHDILTGSRLDGTAFPAGEDRTCNNWTSNSEGSAWVGHADRYSFAVPGSPWN